MFKIDSPGATGANEFTEGNPGLGVPATEVSDEWLNAVQREIVEVVEFSGQTLDKLDDEQLRKAIQLLIGLAGDQQIDQAITNNDPVPVAIAGLIFDKTLFKAARMTFDIERSTDTQNVQETGIMYAVHDTRDDVWKLRFTSQGDDAGVIFDIVAATGQVRQFDTNDLTGSTYLGRLSVTNVIKIKQ